MKNNETGEYELVVGNRQLLSGFFVVVLLCAVAFAMGYVVGQNSPRSAKQTEMAAQPGAAQEARPAAVPPAAPADAAAAPPTAGENQGDAAAQPAEAPPQPVTQPAMDTRAAPAVSTPAPAQAPAPAPVAAADAAAGSYWQVGAWKQAADAQALLMTLRDGGMPAALRTGPDNLIRLVVGPYSDTQTMGRAKTELETRFGLHPIRK